MDIYDDDDILKILDIQAGILKVSEELNRRVKDIEAALERADDVVTSHTERIDALEGEENPEVTCEELEELLESVPTEHVPVTPEELNALTHSARAGITGSADKVPEGQPVGWDPGSQIGGPIKLCGGSPQGKVPESLFMPFIYVAGATEPLRIVKRLRRDKPNDDNWRLSIHDIERLIDLCTDILEREAKW